jgi:hypothetical protein
MIAADRHRRMLGLLRVLPICVLVGSCALMALGMSTIPGHELLFDFKGGLYNAGQAILHGHDPYQAQFLARQAAVANSGGVALGQTSQNAFSIPVYPAPINLAVVPLSLLPFWAAGVIWTLLSVAAMIVGLRLLGVRDWRCIALALVSWPFVFGLDLGALGPILLLGAGVAWRWRDRLWPPALALASIVVAKVFPWTIGAWLLATRRYRALALAIAIAAVACLAAWAVIGFSGMAAYPKMLSNLSVIEQSRAVSIVAVLLAAGVPSMIAKAIALGVTAALLGTAWRLAKRPGGDAQAFGLTIIAALCSTPIVWEHYMVLLFVPIALVSPRLSALWLVPACTPLIAVISIAIVPISNASHMGSHQDIRSAVMWLVLEAIVVWRVLAAGRRPAESRLRFGAPSRILRPARVGAVGDEHGLPA